MNAAELVEQFGPRDSMDYDLVIVGGGPAGLAAAIKAKQLANASGKEISVCVLEKGSEIGAHILSGAVMDPRALNELLPNWQADGAPLNAPVNEDRFFILPEDGATKIPNSLLPKCFHNEGNYVISLGNVCRWLGEQAEALGVEIYPGFAGAEVLFNENGAVRGVATGDAGGQLCLELIAAFVDDVDAGAALELLPGILELLLLGRQDRGEDRDLGALVGAVGGVGLTAGGHGGCGLCGCCCRALARRAASTASGEQHGRCNTTDEEGSPTATHGCAHGFS